MEDLQNLRDRLAAFSRHLEKLRYQVRAGRKEEAATASLYHLHRDLFHLDHLELLNRQLSEAEGTEEHQRVQFLRSFWLEKYMEAETCLELDEVVVANQMDPTGVLHKRESLASMQERLYRKRQEVSSALGFNSYLAFLKAVKPIAFDDLREEAQKILEETEEVYKKALDKVEYMASGIKPFNRQISESHPFMFNHVELANLLSGEVFGSSFTEIELIPTLEDSLFGLGINVLEQSGLVWDMEPRAFKTSSVFCSPIRIPDEILLVGQVRAGLSHYAQFLHELGRAEHFIYTSEELPWEYKRLGDPAVGEAYGLLFQSLTLSRPWLEHYVTMNPEDCDQYLFLAFFSNLYTLRRNAALYLFELDFHQGLDFVKARADYSNHMEFYLQVQEPQESFLVESLEMQSATYLRATMLQFVLQKELLHSSGSDWFLSREAGDKLISLWKHGVKYTADQIAKMQSVSLCCSEVIQNLSENLK